MTDIPKEVLDSTVTLFETSPRDRWRGEVTKLANKIEKIQSVLLDTYTTSQFLEINKAFDKELIEVQSRFDTFASECLDKEIIDLEKRLAGHSHSSVLTAIYIKSRLDNFKHTKKIMTARLNQHHQEFVTMMRRTYTVLHKEKWKPAKAREVFIASVLEMKHGGEIGDHMVTFKNYFEKTEQEIMEGMTEKVKSSPAESTAEVHFSTVSDLLLSMQS